MARIVRVFTVLPATHVFIREWYESRLAFFAFSAKAGSHFTKPTEMEG